VAETMLRILRDWLITALAASRRGWLVLRDKGPTQIQFWIIALLIGTAAGFAALGFRLGISALQTAIYGTDDMRLASVARGLPWWWVLAAPVAGGLVVGLILHRFTPDGRVRAVADGIEGAALNRGRVEIREGLARETARA
jgi:CIC family chloride channel protein